MPYDSQPTLHDLRRAIEELHLKDEESCVRGLTPLARLSVEQERAVTKEAKLWLKDIRAAADKADPIEKLIHRFRITEKEGVALMSLAEALPRIDDDATADALIADKLRQGDWRNYLQHYPDLMSKLAWLGLSLGREVSSGDALSGWIGRMSAGALREAVRGAMKKLGQHFVLGTSIEAAINRSLKGKHALERTSFDMLGEAARTRKAADKYFEAYKNAIAAVAASPQAGNDLFGPSISVKLSALHPRYEWAQEERVMKELTPRLLELVEHAASLNVGITIDAEESERLELSLSVVEKIFESRILRGTQGFGVAVQAYQKRAPAVIDWLFAQAENSDARMTVRLVKGAYWDSEIKRAQERGLSGYPVYTRKTATDVAYMACARKLLDARGRIFPQFGTHNLRTLLAVKSMAGETKDYEVQRLHGMGEAAHRKMLDAGVPSCVYAPVGQHKELLSYLIRRLLENSANSSFVNQMYDAQVDASELTEDPQEAWEMEDVKPHPAIPLPRHIYGDVRVNAAGLELSAPTSTLSLQAKLQSAKTREWHAAPLIDGKKQDGTPRECTSPSNQNHIIGECVDAAPYQCAEAMESLARAFPAWNALPVTERCLPIERLAVKLEENTDEFLALLCLEAGKTIPDAIAEIREAVDFCRYYTVEAKKLFSAPVSLPSTAGETNDMILSGRGVFVCISPWNFPLAIFLGQMTAALCAGNTVAAKPAPQTSLIAARVCALLLECGLPAQVLALLTGEGDVGQALVAHEATAGVVFTGSTRTARTINQTLAMRDGPIVPLIAETGGVNAIIADASSLPEQLIDDVMTSAFRSAGQRCSAARLLCVQDCIADEIAELLSGTIQELRVGDPSLLATDVGPVIDLTAKAKLEGHAAKMNGAAKPLGQTSLGDNTGYGHFVAPSLWEIPHVQLVKEEVFGPYLHIVRFKGDELPSLISHINALGFGLTGGIHSRIQPHIDFVKKNLCVGNIYVNRSIIGAVVGAQPFGGNGLSGTGPKAGGPYYLLRFATERVFTNNVSASGGDLRLLSLR